MLFDHAVLLAVALVFVADITAFFSCRDGAPRLFVWSELAGAAAFGAVATQALHDWARVLLPLVARSTGVCAITSSGAIRERTTSLVSAGLSLLVLVGSAAATLGPDH